MIDSPDRTLGPAELAVDDGTRTAPNLRAAFRAHVDSVWRLARAFGLSAEDADDVTQEVFLVAHRRLPSFRPDASMRAWLFGITRNVVLHHQRSHSARARQLSQLLVVESNGDTPDHTLRIRQAAALMQSFLDGLDVEKRVVFVLADIEGMTTREIAETLALPSGTVSSRLRAARAQLERFALRMQARTSRRTDG